MKENLEYSFFVSGISIDLKANINLDLHQHKGFRALVTHSTRKRHCEEEGKAKRTPFD
jgi:hypothetical protein